MVWYDAKNIAQKDLGFAIAGQADKLVREQLPDIQQDFPNYHCWDCEQAIVDGKLVVKFECKPRGIPCVGYLSAASVSEIVSAVGTARTYEEVRRIGVLQKFFSRENLIFIVDLKDGGFDWDLAVHFIVHWLNEFAVPRALFLNQQRIQRAIPVPPHYSQQEIFEALWVLECELAMCQGTAFSLDGVGLVTCAHVVAETKVLRAFQASNHQEKIEVRIARINNVLDLAVLEIQKTVSQKTLERGNGESQIHDHALVCGFPNYRYGDQGILSPGVIIGTRQQSGIRRLLTNAPIVRGMSGGPAIGKDNKVIGICVTGADRISSADDTEDKSIVPIDALDLL